MIQFKFTQLLIDKRISKKDLAKKTKQTHQAIWLMEKRGTIKPSFLGVLEKTFNQDLTEYIVGE